MDDPDFFDAAYDQPPPAAGGSRPLVICTTPRSGSHRLGRALFDLGLGVQAEYLHPQGVERLGARWGLAVDRQSPGSVRAYWREVCRRRTRNGVVTVSLFGNHIAMLKRLIASSDRPIFVHLYRRSAADQVASLLALYKTKMPYERDERVGHIPDIGDITPRAIRLIDQALRLQNRKWCEYLADKPHLSASSEGFFARPGELLRAIVQRCGVAPEPGRIAAAAANVSRSRAYSPNARIKQDMLRDHAASFAALRDETDDAGDGPAGRIG